MKCNNACSWKGCRVHRTDGTTAIVMETPKLFLCDKHLLTYKQKIKGGYTLTNRQRKLFIKEK